MSGVDSGFKLRGFDSGNYIKIVWIFLKKRVIKLGFF